MTETGRVLLHPDMRCGAELDRWLAVGGGEGLRRAIADRAGLIDRIEAAGLRGLGGSGFPTHIKWRSVAAQPDDGDKYLVCNGNEDEPGTFKDRVLLGETPHQVVEGALIAALACGINRIVFYVNGELGEVLEVIRRAVAQWQASELLTAAASALGKPLELQVVPTSGQYIGGEETAALEWIEGRFPFPRGKPPYPHEQGLYGRPTLINNMETLSQVSHIVRRGADWFRALGVGSACGTKIYSLSGDVLNPGLFELPKGTPLRTLIFDCGGGMLPGKSFKAVFTGGPSNTLLTQQDLDVPLDFDSVRERDSSLGTGAMIVVSQGSGIVRSVARYAEFFARSSCGQCPPCRIGTQTIARLLERIDTGRGSRADLDTLDQLCAILPGSGRCGLLDGTVRLLESSLQHFREEYRQALSPEA